MLYSVILFLAFLSLGSFGSFFGHLSSVCRHFLPSGFILCLFLLDVSPSGHSSFYASFCAYFWSYFVSFNHFASLCRHFVCCNGAL